MTKISTAIATTTLGIKECILTLSLIFGGCCSNVFSLESLVRAQAKSGHLITLSQFLFASSIGLSKHLEFQKYIPYVKFKNRNVPLTSWVLMVILFWLVNVLNNYALGFKISMPFHIIFRSASVLFSMLIGYGFFHRSYVDVAF